MFFTGKNLPETSVFLSFSELEKECLCRKDMTWYYDVIVLCFLEVFLKNSPLCDIYKNLHSEN